MKFDLFVIPFTLGLAFVIFASAYRFLLWIIKLDAEDKQKLVKGLFSLNFFAALWEIFTECLLHRRIFKVNHRLGYMHMSLALGWFILIVIGNLESRYYSDIPVNPPYYPIFFKFFHHYKAVTFVGMMFTFLLDFWLLIILSGITLALIKRFKSQKMGMRRTTIQKPYDRFALISLWLIFPLRLLAESFTAGIYHHGGFMTNSLGVLFSRFLPVEPLSYIAWWGYSLALFVFFISVPFSRYMHIPAEILLISLRKYGIASNNKMNSFADLEVHSCPRCGICIDKCQVVSYAEMPEMATVYYLHSLRNDIVKHEILYNCLQCGRCAAYCPVKIDTDGLRLAGRIRTNNTQKADFSYLSPQNTGKAEVVYFAGCMSHLTPSVKNSMVKIFEKAQINFTFLDQDGSICCGRPLKLSGKAGEAALLMEANRKLIEASGAKTLVTSCPICYKVFNEDYKFNIKVVHHSQYLRELACDGKIKFQPTGLKVVYHDPCELGRGSEIFKAPRQLLNQFTLLQKIENEKEKSLCCGGSLGNFQLNQQQRDAISKETVRQLTQHAPDFIATACPLCKKTLQNASPETEVADLSELTLMAMTGRNGNEINSLKENVITEGGNQLISPLNKK